MKTFANRHSSSLPHRVRTRPTFEVLEDRAVPALLGGELHINTATANDQYSSDVASRQVLNGGSVQVWTHTINETDTDIRAQRYNGNGAKVGGEILVATNLGIEDQPSVAMDMQGRFVVVWTDQLNEYNADIRGRRFAANGVSLGASFGIATGSTFQYDPSVAMDDGGNFVVSYSQGAVNGNDHVYARRYSSNGAFQGQISVATSAQNEHSSSVARTADGRFAIAYVVDKTDTNSDVRMRRYNANGTLASSPIIANSARNETNPEVAMDRNGNAIVVYEYEYSESDKDIKARKVNNAGVLGAIFNVDATGAYDSNPVVALDLSAGDGDFVVAYSRADDYTVRMKEMSTGGGVKASHILSSNGGTPAISINYSDIYFANYAEDESPGDPLFGIFGRRGLLN